MKMTTETPANVTAMQDAADSRWLASTLEHVRADLQAVPTAEAIGRIRERVLGEKAPRKLQRSIAA